MKQKTIKLSDTLTLTDGSLVTLRADDGKYIRRGNIANQQALESDGDGRTSYCVFYVEIIDSESIYLKAENNKYAKRFCCWDNCDFFATTIDTPESFSKLRITSEGGNFINLVADNGQYLARMHNKNKQFISTRPNKDAFCKFELNQLKNLSELNEVQHWMNASGENRLTASDCLISDNREYFATILNDALVVRKSDNENGAWIKWTTQIPSARSHQADYAMLNSYGTIFIFDTDGNRTWTNNFTHKVGQKNDCFIKLQNDGNLVLFEGTPGKATSDALWSSMVDLSPPASENLKSVKSNWLNEANYEDMDVGDTTLLGFFGDGKYEILTQDKTNHSELTIGNVKSGITVTKNIMGPSFAIVGQASLIDQIESGDSGDISAVDISIFQAEAEAVAGAYIGAGASLNMVKGSVSLFDLTLGVGVDTGLGFKDDSLTIKMLGSGIQIGRKVGVSAFGSSFAIDFGRIFS